MRTFVDSNVLIYAHDADAGSKQHIAADQLRELWKSGTGLLSTQVLQEFYVTVCRKLSTPLDRPLARRVIDTYQVWEIHSLDVTDIVAASEIEERHQLSFWDSLIVAAARRTNSDCLLTEDFQTGRRIEGILIENPFP